MKFKRISAALLALVMCMGTISTTAFAHSDESATTAIEETTETVESVSDETEEETEELPYNVTVNEDGTVVFSFNGEEWTYNAEETEDDKIGRAHV